MKIARSLWNFCEMIVSFVCPKTSRARTTESSVRRPAKSQQIFPSGTPASIRSSRISSVSVQPAEKLSPLTSRQSTFPA